MIAQLTILFLILINLTIVLYFSLCSKSDPYKVPDDVKEIPVRMEPVRMEPVRMEPVRDEPDPVVVVPEYFPLGYGPQRYGAHNDYLPDSLYTRQCNFPNCIEFEGLNLEPYIERIMEVNDLIDHENINDLRTF
jgi:hypothetical protein